jgi:hypothetical protein
MVTAMAAAVARWTIETGNGNGKSGSKGGGGKGCG